MLGPSSAARLGELRPPNHGAKVSIGLFSLPNLGPIGDMLETEGPYTKPPTGQRVERNFMSTGLLIIIWAQKGGVRKVGPARKHVRGQRAGRWFSITESFQGIWAQMKGRSTKKSLHKATQGANV